MNVGMPFWITLDIAVLLFVILVLSWRWTMLGLKITWTKLTKPSNIGLHLIRNMSGNFAVPRFIDLDKKEDEFGGKKYVIDSDKISGSRLFGFPFVMHDFDDTKTSLGIYYQQSNKDGIPLYGTVEYKKGNKTASIKQRILKEIKPSVNLPPDTFRAIIASRALSQAIKELFSKYKTQIYLLLGIFGLLGIIVFLNYETFTKFPMILDSLDAIAQAQKNMTCSVPASSKEVLPLG